MVTVKKTRLVNPTTKAGKGRKFGKRQAPAKRKAKRRNPGSLMVLGTLNPQRRSTMKKQRKHKAAPRQNPVKAFKAKKGTHRGRRRSNPSIVSKPLHLMKTAAFAGGGLIATRQIPQMVLGSRNAGPIGYLANLIVALFSAGAVSKFAGKENGFAVGIGGGLYLLNRLISENFSPIPKALALSGVGDHAAAGSLGTVVPGYLPVPVVRDNAGRPIIPAAIIDAIKANLPPVSAPGQTMTGLGARRAY